MNEEKLEKTIFSSQTGNNILLFFSFLVILSFVYLPQISAAYAQGDDYYTWAWDKNNCWDHPIFKGALLIARPIAAYSICFAAKQIEYVRDINLFRFLSLFICSIGITIIYNWLKLFNLKVLLRWLICVSIVTLPAFQVYIAGGGVTAPYIPFGIMMAVGAAMLIYKPVFAARTLKSIDVKFKFALSVLMLIISFLSYQPTPFYFITLVSVPIIQTKINQVSKLKRFIIFYFSAFSMAFIIYLFVHKSFLYFMLQGNYGDEIPYINGITKNIFGKITWFLTEPLVNALNLWNIWPSIIVATLVLIVISSGIVLEIREAYFEVTNLKILIKNTMIKYGLILSLIPLTYLPNLIADWNYPMYRTIGAVSILILMLFILSLKRSLDFIFDFAFKVNKQQASYIVLFFLVSLGILTANYNLRYLFAESNAYELNYIEVEILNYIAKYGKENLSHIHIIRPTNKSILANNHRYDEIGFASSYSSQNVLWMIKCAMKELNIGTQEYIEIDKIKLTTSSLEPGVKNEYNVDSERKYDDLGARKAYDQKMPDGAKALIINMNNLVDVRLRKTSDINLLKPILVETSYKGFDILSHKNKLYALSQDLAPIDMTQVELVILKECQSRSTCFVNSSLSETKRSIDEFYIPKLVEEGYRKSDRKFNIVFYKNKFYAIAQNFGSLDLTQVDVEVLKECQLRSMCFIESSLSEVKLRIDKH